MIRIGHIGLLALALAASTALAGAARADTLTGFTGGDLVISVYGNGSNTGNYSDNQAAPITLEEVTTTGTAVGSITLPRTTTTTNGVTNNAISGEYGSSSEGNLQLSGNGAYLTIAGYGVNADTYNANPASFGGTTKSCITGGASAVTCYPLAQTPSSAVSRVVALVGADGSVDTSTALTNVYSGNNPRSVATVDGSTFYLAGQGATSAVNDATQGVFVAQRGATTATAVDNSYEARSVQIYNNQLYVSSDTTEGAGVHENISTYGTLPTGAASAAVLSGISSKFLVSSTSQLNAIDGSIAGNTKIYLSPENYFFANATTLYVADSGNPKGDNNGKSKAAQGLSDGGLQKWSFNGQTWVLDYTLSNGLGLTADTTSCGSNQVGCGTTGLIGLTGEVVNGVVDLFATNSTLGDLDQTYLYGITDTLASVSAATSSAEAFSIIATAAPDTVIRGVAFAPQAATVPEPSSLAFLAGLLPMFLLLRRKRQG